MPRRAASGHMPATQLSKFAAASRMAAAVIRGWPDAPSSPLQGGAPPGPGAACGACALLPGLKRLLRKLDTPSPELWALTGAVAHSMAASASAPARPIVDDVVRRFISRSVRPNIPV